MLATAADDPFDGLTWPDYAVIVGYFLFVLAVGLYVSIVQAYICT